MKSGRNEYKGEVVWLCKSCRRSWYNGLSESLSLQDFHHLCHSHCQAPSHSSSHAFCREGWCYSHQAHKEYRYLWIPACGHHRLHALIMQIVRLCIGFTLIIPYPSKIQNLCRPCSSLWVCGIMLMTWGAHSDWILLRPDPCSTSTMAMNFSFTAGSSAMAIGLMASPVQIRSVRAGIRSLGGNMAEWASVTTNARR